MIPYLYLTGNIPAFGQLTQDGLAPVSYGQMSVLPLVKAAHAAGVPGTAPIATGVFYPIPFESFSNYSWLGTFWLDFRAIGVLLLAGLTGLLASYARCRLAQAPSVASIWAASLLMYVIVVSPFANAWTATLVWQYLLLTPVVALALDRRVFQRWSNGSGPRRDVRWLPAPAPSPSSDLGSFSCGDPARSRAISTCWLSSTLRSARRAMSTRKRADTLSRWVSPRDCKSIAQSSPSAHRKPTARHFRRRRRSPSTADRMTCSSGLGLATDECSRHIEQRASAA